MNLNHLEYFMAACDCGSISDAAKQVYVSQQSVSAAISSLEHELHTTLLVRSRQGVAPTPEGRMVYATAQKIYGELDDLRRNLAQGRLDVSGPLGFAYQPEVFLSCGPSFEQATLNDFKSNWPGISLETFRGQSDFCLAAVKQESVEMALVSSITDASFRVINVWESPVNLYVHRSHPLASLKQASFADLRDQTIVAPPNGGYPLWEIVNRCQRYGFSPNIVSATMEDGPYHFCKPGNNAVSFVLSGWMAYNRDPDYATIPLAEPDRISIPANVITRAGATLSPQAEALIEHLRRSFRKVDDALRAAK